MSQLPSIGDDDIILRRLPPPDPESGAPDQIVELPDGSHRASSASFQPRDGEEGVSCSLLRLTSPQQLLELLRLQEKDPAGWKVCFLRVGDVTSEGLVVVPVYDPFDPGHCEIRPGANKLAEKRRRRVARRTRVLTPAEVAAGGPAPKPIV